MITLLVHINNQDSIKIDVDDIPQTTDNVLIGKNPRDKTDKELEWLEDGVTSIVFPWWRVTFIEVLPSPSDEAEFPLPFRND
jgi:hypothetical protein